MWLVLQVCALSVSGISAQVGNIPREEQQENKAQQTRCSLCFPGV